MRQDPILSPAGISCACSAKVRATGVKSDGICPSGYLTVFKGEKREWSVGRVWVCVQWV